MSKEYCNICCDSYNKSTREKICCGYCEFPACKTCCETYILSETIPKCMNTTCAKEWSRKFIREKFTNVFINTRFKNHLEELLFDQEKALLPATQPIIEEKIRKDNIKKQMSHLDDLIQDLFVQKRQLERNLYTNQIDTSSKKVSNYVRACSSEDCRGFLSSQWKCGICEQWTCPECHELKGFDRDCEHTCNPELVETAKLLAKDTKSCPTCQTKIFKIDGCDQMWCTQCHTAFSWKTGAIQTNIHNPHFYEWQRKNGGAPRAAGDVECGRELHHTTFENVRNAIVTGKHVRFLQYYKPDYDWNTRPHSLKSHTNVLSNIIRRTIHNDRIELPQFRTDHLERNQELRVQYLCNEIDEDIFKILVQRNDKKHRKNNEISQVIQVSITASTDIVFRIIDDLKKSTPDNDKFDELMSEFNGVREYCNEIFKDISFAYSCVQYGFDDEFVMRTIPKEKKAKKAKSEDSEDEEE